MPPDLKSPSFFSDKNGGKLIITYVISQHCVERTLPSLGMAAGEQLLQVVEIDVRATETWELVIFQQATDLERRIFVAIDGKRV